MAKKKSVKWVRLSNGVIENEDVVGAILLDLRSLATNSSGHFEIVAQFAAGISIEIPGPLEARLRQLKFIKPDMEVAFYDDVRDVIECCSEWFGNRAKFEAKNLLDLDQTNIKPPE